MDTIVIRDDSMTNYAQPVIIVAPDNRYTARKTPILAVVRWYEHGQFWSVCEIEKGTRNFGPVACQTCGEDLRTVVPSSSHQH